MKFKNKAIEWINGELLGDGCLQSYSPYSARFTYSSKYSEYIEYIRDTIKSLGINGGKIYKYLRTIKSYDYKYASLCYTELLPIRNKWYFKGKKIVPKNLNLTPLTCRQWYIGCGSLKCQGKRNPHILIYTDCFSTPDINLLLEKLTNLKFKVSKVIHCSNKWNIYISSYSTKKFLNYIGKCLVKCYEYKFDYFRKWDGKIRSYKRE